MRVFLERLAAAKPANSAGQALALLAENLNAVEDEHSGVGYNPKPWKDDAIAHDII